MILSPGTGGGGGLIAGAVLSSFCSMLLLLLPAIPSMVGGLMPAPKSTRVTNPACKPRMYAHPKHTNPACTHIQNTRTPRTSVSNSICFVARDGRCAHPSRNAPTHNRDTIPCSRVLHLVHVFKHSTRTVAIRSNVQHSEHAVVQLFNGVPNLHVMHHTVMSTHTTLSVPACTHTVSPSVHMSIHGIGAIHVTARPARTRGRHATSINYGIYYRTCVQSLFTNSSTTCVDCAMAGHLSVIIV